MLQNLIFIFIITLGLAILFFLPDKNYPRNLHYALPDKHKHLSEIASPRIILIGGSNLSLGLNSERIKDQLNINVYNTGIEYGYGIKWICNDLFPFIRKNDIIIISPEYENFFDDNFWGTLDLLPQLIDVDPKNFFSISLYHWSKILKYVPQYTRLKVMQYLKSNLNNKDEFKCEPYLRNSFDSFGDVRVHWDEKRIAHNIGPLEGQYNPKTLKYLLKFQERVNSNGAHLFITFPVYEMSSYVVNEQKINFVFEQISASNLMTLNSPERYVLNDTLFYDTRYHLRRLGVETRTEFLIEDIKKNSLLNLPNSK